MAATAPVWKANGTAASGTGTVPVAWPAGHAAGDFALLLVNASAQAVSPAPAGWTEIIIGTVTGTAGAADSVTLQLFWRFATSGAEANVTLPDTGDHTLGVITTFTGVDPSLPIETAAPCTVKSTNSTSDTFPAITTVGTNRLIVACISTGQESVKSAATFAGLASFTARGVGVTTSGVDGGIACFSGVKVTAGSTGTGSVTESITSKAISTTLALRPVDFEQAVTVSAGIPTGGSVGAMSSPAGVWRAGEVFAAGIPSAEAVGTPYVGTVFPIEKTVSVLNYVGNAGTATVINNLPVQTVLRAAIHISLNRSTRTEGSDNGWTFPFPASGDTTLQSQLTPYMGGFDGGFSPSIWATGRGIQHGTGSNYSNGVGEDYTLYSFAAAPGFMGYCTYVGTGTGVSQTVAHSLGVTPGFIIVAPRDNTVTATGCWYHKDLGPTKHVNPRDSTVIVASSSTRWNSTAPTSTQLTVSGDNNVSGVTYFVYLFGDRASIHNYVAVGTYAGNGSSSGPAVSLGWKPRIVGMFNAAAAAVNNDTTRAPRFMDADTSGNFAGGGTGRSHYYGQGGTTPGVVDNTWHPEDQVIDALTVSSDGFQVVTSDNGFNRSGETYYFIAFRSLDQYVTEAGAIASAEASGAHTVTLGAAGGTQNVTVTAGVATAEAIGAHTITPGAVSVSPGGIASAESVGSPTVTPGAATISPSGIASAGAFGTATLSPGAVTLSPSGLASGEAIGAHTLVPGAVTLSPSGVTSAEAFGTPVVSAGQVVQPTGVASAEALGAATVTAGAVSIAPAGIGTTEAVGAPVVAAGAVSIAPAGVASAGAFGSATVAAGAVSVAPAGVASGETLGSPVVAPGAVTLAPAGVASLDAVGAPALTATATIDVPGITTADGVGTPELLASYAVSTSGIASAEAVGEPSLSSAITLQPGGIASLEAVGTPAIASAGAIAVVGIPSAEDVGEPTLTPGAVQLDVVAIEGEDEVGVPVVVVGGVVISLVGIASQEGVGTPEIATGPVAIEPEGIASAAELGTPAILPGPVALQLAGIPGEGAMGTPALGNVADVTLLVAGIASAGALGTALVARRSRNSHTASQEPAAIAVGAQTPEAVSPAPRAPAEVAIAELDPVEPITVLVP